MSNDRCISGSQEVVSFDSPAFHNYNYLWAEPRYEFPEASCGGFHKEPCKSSTMNRMSADRYLRRRTLVKSAAARELIAEVASIDKVDWSAVPPHYLTDSSIPSKYCESSECNMLRHEAKLLCDCNHVNRFA